MFKFQKFHFRTEKFAKSGFIHQRIVVRRVLGEIDQSKVRDDVTGGGNADM